MKRLLSDLVKANLTLCILMCATWTFAQSTPDASCSFQPLDVPGAFSSSGGGINDFGAVVGGFSPDLRSGRASGFLLFRGKYTTFNFPGSPTTSGNDINDLGEIVGTYFDASSEHGFILRGTEFRALDVEGAVNGTQALGLNNLGAIVGGFVDASGDEKGFLRQRNGDVATLIFPGAVVTEANGINDRGNIVGTYRQARFGTPIHGFVFMDGEFTTLDFPGARDTFPSRINDRKVVVGTYDASDGEHGFSWANGKFTTINEPDGPSQTFINGLNNLNQITGGFANSSIFGAKAFTASCRDLF